MKAAPCILLLLLLLVIYSGCSGTSSSLPVESTQPSQLFKTRELSIPADAVKMTPEMDVLPPILHSGDYYEPVPLSPVINTAGGEDSPFILGDASALYFFFTPDVNIPAEEQLFDGVTGIWVSYRKDGQWQTAQRVLLQDADELALDGCEYVRGNEIWFCTARVGNYRGIDIWVAEFRDGIWTDWKNAGEKLNVEYKIGEFHITSDGTELYFHSDRAGGTGGVDIWVSRMINGEWQTPENVTVVNTPETEGWPFITADGSELWFTRFYLGSPAIFVSRKTNGQWGEPELIISQFAGEPTLDTAGNIYFTHHYYVDGKMVEADIYVAYRK
ncbi:MAG: hypothetical protein A2Y89_07570 [Chloroflexi bacterium RBG_13_51_18]|nr:MAG: hypothetical protein A2Y89_07570 [Chloroflexi bacterium RBG_13_51_18]